MRRVEKGLFEIKLAVPLAAFRFLVLSTSLVHVVEVGEYTEGFWPVKVARKKFWFPVNARDATLALRPTPLSVHRRREIFCRRKCLIASPLRE